MKNEDVIDFLKEEYKRLEPIVIQSRDANDILEGLLKKANATKNLYCIGAFNMLVGIKFFYLGEYALANNYFQKVEKSKSIQPEIYHKNLYWLSAVNYINGRKAEPLKMIQEAVNYFVNKDFQQYNYLCLSLQASIFLDIGFYDESFVLQEQCAQYYYQEGNYRKYIIEKIQISNTFYSLSKFQEAYDTLHPIYEQYKEIIDNAQPIFRANYWKNMGDLLLEWNKVDESFLCYQKIIELNIDDLHPYFKGSFYISYGHAFGKKKEFERALHYTQCAMTCAEKIASSKQILLASQNLADIYLEINEFAKSKQYLDRGIEICKTSIFGIMEAQLNETYAKWHNKNGNYEVAQKHLLETIRIKDEINAKESDIRIEALRALNQLKLREKELSEANKEIALQKQELELTTYYLNQKNTILSDLENFIKSLRSGPYSKQKMFDLIQQKIHLTKISNIEQESFKEKLNQQNLKFTAILKKQFPTVSKTEAQVASLLIKGLNTKEISDILVIEPRSIEMHRYRLRKKLNLDKSVDLQSFLLGIVRN